MRRTWFAYCRTGVGPAPAHPPQVHISLRRWIGVNSGWKLNRSVPPKSWTEDEPVEDEQ
jgi:hypothetical protein